MTARIRRSYRDGINQYVPGMQYASDMVHGQPTAVSLGAPAAQSASAIAAATAANAAANTIVAAAYTSDSPYGRSIILTPSGDPGAVGGTIDVYGYDYLGQPMVERFAGANGVTSILYGKKAFYKTTQTKIVTASTNAVTWAIGIGRRLGLPYKGDLVWAKENDALVALNKRDVIVWVDRAAAKAVAGGSDMVYAEFPGFVKTLIGVPGGGGGATDPVITVKLATVAIVGLTVTIDTSDTTGLTVTDLPTTVGYSANNRFIVGDRIEIVGAAAAGAFSDRVGVELTPTQFLPGVTTDPQTTTTGDPRGTYESLMVMDGVKTIVVGLVGDNAVNSSGNGGLHGIKHVVS
jgi:hypothetical protein